MSDRIIPEITLNLHPVLKGGKECARARARRVATTGVLMVTIASGNTAWFHFALIENVYRFPGARINRPRNRALFFFFFSFFKCSTYVSKRSAIELKARVKAENVTRGVS